MPGQRRRRWTYINQTLAQGRNVRFIAAVILLDLSGRKDIYGELIVMRNYTR